MGKHVKFSMETQRDSVWNTLWNFHGYSVKSQWVSKTPWSLRGVLIWFGWREITMETSCSMVIPRSIPRVIPWSVHRKFHIFSSWKSMGYKAGSRDRFSAGSPRFHLTDGLPLWLVVPSGSLFSDCLLSIWLKHWQFQMLIEDASVCTVLGREYARCTLQTDINITLRLVPCMLRHCWFRNRKDTRYVETSVDPSLAPGPTWTNLGEEGWMNKN